MVIILQAYCPRLLRVLLLRIKEPRTKAKINSRRGLLEHARPVYLVFMSPITIWTLDRASSFQISSGFSCCPAGRMPVSAIESCYRMMHKPSNIVTLASALSLMASMKIGGKNFCNTSRI